MAATVDRFIGSSNRISICVLIGTPVDPSAGLVSCTIGGTRSAVFDVVNDRKRLDALLPETSRAADA